MITNKSIGGIKEFILDDWDEFHSLVVEKMIHRNYVFRGQRNSTWKLEPTLNRIFKSQSEAEFKKTKRIQLDNFKKSIRGRTKFYNDIIKDENEIWALGQHNFLNTPLLDFTESPYVAAYFAFHEYENDSEYRVIYAVSQKNITDNHKDDFELFTPISDFNNRLISQSGLFVKYNTKDDLENLVKIKYLKNKDGKIKIFKIKIKNNQREKCLISLNRMNINHNTLFPDLFGSALYCNIGLEIKNY